MMYGRNPDGARKPRILVLGTGFAGTAFMENFARTLKKDRHENVDLVAVNSTNYLLFAPLLYQVATGQVYGHHISIPVCCEVRKHGFRFLETKIKDVNFERNEVETADSKISYDQLILALGTESNDFGIEGVSKYAISLKTLNDGERIRNRVLESFRLATQVLSTKDIPDSELTFVVIGGGASGVELAGSLAEYLRILGKDYGDTSIKTRIILIEAQERLMMNTSEKFSKKLADILRKRGVDVLLGAKVKKITEDNLFLADGRVIKSKDIFWTAGVKSNPIVSSIGGEKLSRKNGRIIVDEYLRIPDFPNVYVLGDNAYPMPDAKGVVLPQTAAAAVQEGKYLGKALAAKINSGKDALPFKYKDPGIMLSLGRFDGLCQFSNGIIFSGFSAWLIWRFVHLVKISTVENKLEVLLDWIFSSFGKEIVIHTG